MAKIVSIQQLAHINRIFQKKQFVFIVSTMRSGSTLLKSLLANAADVSHLPEIPFHKFRWYNKFMLKTLSEKPIVVLKKPSWANEKNYPNIPYFSNNKIIILYRHPGNTIQSIHNAYVDKQPNFTKDWPYERILNTYWLPTYERIKNIGLLEQDNVQLIRYETLVANPVESTKKLFRFIGSAESKGFDSYKANDAYYWEWGKDDGSEKIKSLQVQASQRPIDPDILQLLETNKNRIEPIERYFNT